jgi:hypothetical protein
VLCDGATTTAISADRRRVAVHPAWTREEISRQAAELGALDIVVVLLHRDHWPADVEDHGDLWSLLFLHLRERGWYVVVPDDGSDEPGLAERDALLPVMAAGEPATEDDERRGEIREAADTIRVSPGLVAIRKRLTHYYKVSHDRANDLLPAREQRLGLSVMQTLPGGVLRSRAVVPPLDRSDEVSGFDELMPYPDLHLRRYDGRIGFCGATLLFTGHTVLPDSFRWHMENSLSNFRLSEGIPEFGRIETRLRPRKRLPGPFYQLDMGFIGHFGHLMTLVVSRLWGWEHAKSEIPDLKALSYTRRSHFEKPQPEIDFFTRPSGSSRTTWSRSSARSG